MSQIRIFSYNQRILGIIFSANEVALYDYVCCHNAIVMRNILLSILSDRNTQLFFLWKMFFWSGFYAYAVMAIEGRWVNFYKATLVELPL